MINEASTKTFINNSNIIIAQRFLKLQTLYSNIIHDIIKVHDKLIDKESVLKIIKNKKNKNLLENEFRIIMKLNHRNILRGYELYSYRDLFFYSMEFIQTKFENKYINQYIKDILNSFEYLHENNLIHNDIKLNNFIFNNKRAVLIDFSKSKRINTYSDIKNENLILSRFLIQWINYNLKIDLIGSPESAENFIDKNDINKLIKMFYGEKYAI